MYLFVCFVACCMVFWFAVLFGCLVVFCLRCGLLIYIWCCVDCYLSTYVGLLLSVGLCVVCVYGWFA